MIFERTECMVGIPVYIFSSRLLENLWSCSLVTARTPWVPLCEECRSIAQLDQRRIILGHYAKLINGA